MKCIILSFIFLCITAGTLFSQCYEVYFTNSYGSPHYGDLTVYQDGSAWLQVQYPDGKGGWNCVEQYGKYVQYRVRGVLIHGIECYRPTYCGTSIRNYGYNADNLYWAFDSYGNVYMINSDDWGETSDASITQVSCN